VNGTEHMVIGQKMVKAQLLNSSANPPNSGGISVQLDLRIDDADLHGPSLPREVSRTTVITAELTLAHTNPAMAELIPLAEQSLAEAEREIDDLWTPAPAWV
jgi:hypothetical protein